MWALTPTSRATSSAFRPASICLTAAIICASVCLLLDIVPHLPEYENRTRFCAENGDQANVGSIPGLTAYDVFLKAKENMLPESLRGTLRNAGGQSLDVA